MEQIITLKVDLFLPPYGDGVSSRNATRWKSSFSPPYGDSIIYLLTNPHTNMFSPPCGDCTAKDVKDANADMFSPPYGDCTINISQNTAKLKSRMARKYSLCYNDVLLR